MTGISKQDLLAQVQDPRTKAVIAGLGNDGDEMTSLLYTALLAAYKAQQRINQDLPPGQNLNSLTAPVVQQQSGSDGSLYVVKTISLRVTSPISDEVAPFVG
ncbi:hypothetical protein QUB56_35375 [Microcoleus sp. AR_TQ3_B6]|uniref:hypothetical protein n=1 Tax=Microcoleus sp. AR_TQ3_B6 TaxID=3055284 RepID=UPI002FD47AF6